MSCHISVSASISFFGVLQFSDYRSFISLVRFILRFLIFGAMVNGIVFFWGDLFVFILERECAHGGEGQTERN